MDHLWLLGRGVVALIVAGVLLVVAERRRRATAGAEPADIGLD